MGNANRPNPSRSRQAAIDALAIQLKAQLYEAIPETWEPLINSAKASLDEAIEAHDEHAANRLWFLHKVATMRAAYLRAIEQLKQQQYYEGWCALEQVELGLASLRKNPFYDPHDFAVLLLTNLVTNWQRIFPYHVFFSPEFAIRREECAICGNSVDPWSSCTHEPGKVYCGKECYRIVKECELLGISLVRDPVQRYSLARVFTTDSSGKQVDQFDCSSVKFVAERIRSPFTNWDAIWTKALHPHSLFGDRPHDGPCPCDSGKPYKDCCLSAEGVIRPHLQIRFDEHPPDHLPTVEFSGYDTGEIKDD
jgi:SEC-C motif